MATVFKTLALIILLAALGYAGFYGGQYLRGVAPTDIDITNITADDFIPRAKPIQPADKPYAVNPTVGPLTRSIPVKRFSARGDGLYEGIFAAGDRDAVSRGQGVVFYDRDDALLPVAGYVDHADSTDGNDDATVIFKIDLGVDEYGDPYPVPDLTGARARIVTIDTVVKRVPVGALFKDSEGNTYVWKAVPDGQGAYHILHQRVFAGVIGDDYAEIGPEIALEDLVLANPPDDIENGQVRDILTRGMNAPLHGTADQANIHRGEQKARQTYLERAAFQAATTPGGLGGCAANISPEGLPADILSIRSPLDAPGTAPVPGAAPNGASTGCSSCSSAAAPVVPLVDGAATTPATTETPAATGGCGGCGASGSYGGSPDPAVPDGPATTQ